MKNLVKKLKGLNISPVTGKEPADQVEPRWMSTAKTVKDRIGMSSTEVKIELTDPDTVTAVIENAPWKEVPAILMKIVQDVDKDGWAKG